MYSLSTHLTTEKYSSDTRNVGIDWYAPIIGWCCSENDPSDKGNFYSCGSLMTQKRRTDEPTSIVKGTTVIQVPM